MKFHRLGTTFTESSGKLNHVSRKNLLVVAKILTQPAKKRKFQSDITQKRKIKSGEKNTSDTNYSKNERIAHRQKRDKRF